MTKIGENFFFFFFFHVAGVAFSKSITVFMVISFPYSRITMNLPRFTLPVSHNHNEEVSIFHRLNYIKPIGNSMLSLKFILLKQ